MVEAYRGIYQSAERATLARQYVPVRKVVESSVATPVAYIVGLAVLPPMYQHVHRDTIRRRDWNFHWHQ
jgi:hypothetical protein